MSVNISGKVIVKNIRKEVLRLIFVMRRTAMRTNWIIAGLFSLMCVFSMGYMLGVLAIYFGGM